MIRIRRLSYVYSDGQKALENVDFTIEDGESVALVGPNGAGKTTLFLALAGILRIPSGHISVADCDPGILVERRRLPGKLGIVFQNSEDQVFNSTVFDDVAFGPLNQGLDRLTVKERVREALARVDLQGYESRVPFHLSGGEQRRVALAGILAMKPSILLLDEPSQGLDPRGRRELILLLNHLSGTKIIASHDLELIIQTCSRVLLLDGGRIITDGPARNVLAHETLMKDHGLEVPHSLRPHGDAGKHPAV